MCSLSTFSQKNDLIYLWPGKVPGETKEKQPPAIDVSKSDNIIRFSEVTNPAIEVYLPNPSLKNESAVIVCPGGSLSARASTLFTKRTYHAVDKSDSLSCRPSFTMLIYPAYLDQGPNLTITPELELSKEVLPVFIFQTADDPYGNSSLVMAGALRNAKLPVELHIIATGDHGYGLRPGKLAAETWPVLAEKWLSSVLKTK